MSTRSTRASARKRKQPASSSPVKAAPVHKTPPGTPQKAQQEMDTPDWLSDLDIHLSPKATASRSKSMASVKKTSPSKRSLYVFTSSSQSSDPEASPQKIGAKSFYSAKSKGKYLSPLERKQMREKMNKSADDADLTQNKSALQKKNPKVTTAASKKTAPKKPRQTKSSTKKSTTTSKTKPAVKKAVKTAPVTKTKAKSPRNTVKKSPSKKVPQKSPRRSIPKRSPWKATTAKKGIQMYMQSLQKVGKSGGKSATKAKKKEDKMADMAILGSSQSHTSPKKTSPTENQAEDDKASAMRGLDFGASVDEIDEEVTDIQQRIQDLIDTSFDEAEDEDVASTPRGSVRKRKMKTEQQSLQGSELPKTKRQRVASPVKSSTPSKTPRKSSSTPKKTPQKQDTPSKRTASPEKIASPRKRATPSNAATPSKTATPNKAASPSKKSSTPSKKSSTPSKSQSATASASPRKSPGRPGRAAKSPYKGIHPDTPDSSSLTSQESPRNALSKVKEQTRMFPMFTPPTSPSVRSTPPSRNRSPLLKKLVDKDGTEQLTLDVGQKRFGTTICKTCSMVYTLAHPEDEANHSKFHKKYLTYIKFPGWKTETILQEFHDGRILIVTSDSPKYALKKIEEVRELVDHELGFLEGSSIADKASCKTLLFVTLDKKVAGCLIAEEIEAGYRVIPDDPSQSSSQEEAAAKEQQRAWCCQTTPVRAVCGISRIWVAATMRQKNIGRRMVDCIRNNFVYGSILTMDDIAFSDPTPDGKGFAIKYTGTPSFLVYKYKT